MNKICKQFGDVSVLKDVDLTVYEGEVLALMGENGAGKSTLMKILCGVHPFTRGTIRLDEKEIFIASVRDAMRMGIAFIHQELNLVENLDIAGNIFLGREPVTRWGWPDKKRMSKETAGLLARVGLDARPETPVRQLSLASQQLVEIAKALSLRSRILIMDEPTSSLTMKETALLFDTVADLKSKGTSVIYISHRMNEIMQIADRVVVLKDGKNGGELKKEELNHASLVRLMVGRNIDRSIFASRCALPNASFNAESIRTHRYPHQPVSFSLNSGKITGIAGLVGSGRTELVESVCGIRSLIAGSVYLDGKAIRIKSPSDAIRQGIFLVPEDRKQHGIITGMSITENLSLPNLHAYSTMSLVRQAKESFAARAQVDNLDIRCASLQHLLKDLSGGNQQKVAIGKWLSRTARLMVFDEPTRGVDVGAKAEIYRIMRRLADEGAMVLVVSSDMEELMIISDRMLVMHEGRISGELLSDEFTEQRILSYAFGNG
ncbi:sugar ABC transporter ATP-binding protein [Flavitalea sp. BT771]|uniref:sugar ABC transporter ATP-binding protein n=1 Tax=Flavitalea sp. BT771 TaxID=3063329 RepID=UPI0026E401CA|nr:sugar ABC transporter ATP-binding protein [Flavitalea sp. BT771]MDO6435434.1 sugar ABC transporter ATP-binding protein [Flavitalea sp. BT771]MDV6224206.1 sugar ABC transporter ATP-binding protein [Flavitalea sp. BT771]